MNSRPFLVIALISILATGICKSQNCSQIQSRYNEARSGLQRDAHAINSLGFEQTTDGIEEWVKTGKDVQDEAYKEFMNGLVSYVLQSAQVGMKTWGSMGPPQANAYITKLKGYGINSKPWFDSLREAAYTAGKPAATGETQALLAETGHVVDVVGALPQPQKDVGWTDIVQLVLSVGGGLVKAPQAGFTLAGWSFLTSLAWSTVDHTIVPARINQLANLSDQQLTALASIERVVHRHVAAMQSAQAQMATQGCGTKANKLGPAKVPTQGPGATATCTAGSADPQAREQLVAAMNSALQILNNCEINLGQCKSNCAGSLGSSAFGECLAACGNCDSQMATWQKGIASIQTFDADPTQKFYSLCH